LLKAASTSCDRTAHRTVPGRELDAGRGPWNILICRDQGPTCCACSTAPAYRDDMVSFIKSVTFDCREPLHVTAFWAAALGSNVDEDTKVAKNRQHFDLRPTATRASEVRRLVALGAHDSREHDDIVVMVDPEGNEFCVE